MTKWLRVIWQQHVESLNCTRAVTGSAPAPTLFIVSLLTVLFGLLAYLPAFSATGRLEHAWVAVALSWLAGAASYAGWRHEGRGSVGVAATSLATLLYPAALLFAAMNTPGSLAIVLSLLHGLALVCMTAQLFVFSVMLVIAVSLPLLTMLPWFRPPLEVALITTGSTCVMLLLTYGERKRRVVERQQWQERQANDSTRWQADEDVQTALTTTLLTLGNLLHELANWQTAIATNLEYIRLCGQLSDDVERALSDACLAQQEQQRLLRSTIAELKGRARATSSHFVLAELLTEVTTASHRLRVEVRPAAPEIELSGNPAHLRVVLLNLIRNAEDAGATRVVIEPRLDEDGCRVSLVVHNDGQPITEGERSRLFDSFIDSSKTGGSGLGLYLCRRYVQLLGGAISLDDGPLGGAAFRVCLPSRAPSEPGRPRRDRE